MEARTIESTAGAWRGAGTASDDRRVVAAVLSGDRDAFRTIVDREGPTVIAACTRVLGDHGEAEDVAQEAFVIAYRSLASWRGEGPFGAWLARIAVRLAVRAARRRKSVPWVRAIGPDGEGEHPAERLHAGAGSDPEGLALRGERIATLRAAVAALDEPYREVVALRFFGERSLEEIASATGRPLGTVKTHLHRGLLRLRTAMSPGSAR
jgi:RNA polymerase sigma-70 factor (ECF subfamily)